MGGFTAILFANLVEGGEAIAFAPQNFICRFKRLLYKDRRWRKQISNTYRRCANKEKIFDLRNFLMQSDFIPKISIFVSKDDRLDYIHAEQLRVFQNVNIYVFEGGGHNIVKCLRDLGKLPTILSGNFAYEAQQKITI